MAWPVVDRYKCVCLGPSRRISKALLRNSINSALVIPEIIEERCPLVDWPTGVTCAWSNC